LIVMNCEHCQEHLLDLVYGELEANDADAYRAHVDGCDECRASFEKLGMAQRLATQLTMLEPAPAMSSAIMAAAHQHVGAAEPSPAEVAPAATADDEGLWASILRWAGSFAMGPQVAMATIMLLVVSIGLWYFPNRQRTPEGTGSTVMTPDVAGEVGPTATLTPADPLELDLDERSGRIRTRDDGESRDVAQLARQTERPAAGPTLEAQDDFRQNTTATRDEAGAVVDGRLAEARAPEEERNQEQARPATALDVDSLADLGAGGAARAGSSASSSTEATRGRAYEGAVSGRRSAPRRQAVAPTTSAPSAATPAPAPTNRDRGEAESAPAQQQGAAPAEPAPANAREAYTRGMQRYQRGNFWGAAEDFNRVYRNPEGQESLVPSALHHLARSYRRANRCNLAEPQYRSLLSRFPRYSGTPRAMMELAGCYRQLGRLSDARATLEGAQRHASVATEARRELMRIRQMERAADRMDAMEADEAAAEAAY